VILDLLEGRAAAVSEFGERAPEILRSDGEADPVPIGHHDFEDRLGGHRVVPDAVSFVHGENHETGCETGGIGIIMVISMEGAT